MFYSLNESFWCTDYSAKTSAHCIVPFLKKSRKTAENGFSWSFQKLDFTESLGFLRCTHCIKTLNLSYQIVLSDDFHFLPCTGGGPIFQTPGPWGPTMFLVKKKNVGWFVITKGTKNHPGQEKFGLVPPRTQYSHYVGIKGRAPVPSTMSCHVMSCHVMSC